MEASDRRVRLLHLLPSVRPGSEGLQSARGDSGGHDRIGLRVRARQYAGHIAKTGVLVNPRRRLRPVVWQRLYLAVQRGLETKAGYARRDSDGARALAL